MALRVWLPLNGNLNNQGLGNCAVTNSGATIDNSGKIGKTYLFDANDDFISIDSADMRNIFKGGSNPFTIAFWIYNTKTTGTRAVPFGDYGLTGTIQFNLELNSSAGNWNDDIRFYWNGNPDYRATGTSATPNTWVHLVIVYDGTKVEFYRNGILVNTRAGTLAALNKTSGAFYLGRDSRTGGTAFGGKINDFRVYDECLSPKQIKEISKGLVAHYKLTGVGANPNLLVDAGNRNKWIYENCIKVNDTDSKAIGFSVSSANQRIYLEVTNVWNSGQKYTYSFDAKASVDDAQLDASRSIADFGPNHYLTTEWQHYSGKISSTATADAGTLSIRGKTANVTYYLKNIKLENGEEETNYIPNINDIEYITMGYENDICVDVSGNGYNLTQVGSPIFNSDSPRYGGSTTFSSLIFNSSAGAVLASSKDFTINGWFYHVSGTSYYASADSYNTSVCLESGRFFVYQTNGTPPVGYWTATNNVWQMVTLVHNSIAKTLTLYVDGVQKAQVTTDGTINSNNILNIGGRQNSAEYNGSISDFRIYSTALSADDILTIYKNSGIIDNKGNVYTYEFKEE